MLSVLEGEVEITFRGVATRIRPGQTVNVPANAPHGFRNVSGAPARMLCMCTPPGLEKFLMSVGVPVPTRTSPSPDRDEAAEITRIKALGPDFQIEFLA
jgi:uncharacterized cupin superfamily protein